MQTTKSPMTESAEAFTRKFPKIAKRVPDIRNHKDVLAGQRKTEELESQLKTVRAEICDVGKGRESRLTDAESLLAGESLSIVPHDRMQELRRMEGALQQAIELQRQRSAELWLQLIREACADLADDARGLVAAICDMFEAALVAIDDFEGFLSYVSARGLKPIGRPGWWELMAVDQSARRGGHVEPLRQYVAWRRQQAGLDPAATKGK